MDKKIIEEKKTELKEAILTALQNFGESTDIKIVSIEIMYASVDTFCGSEELPSVRGIKLLTNKHAFYAIRN